MNACPTNWKAGFKGRFVPACGGKEEPYPVAGKWWLYVLDTKTGQHLFYCYEDDVFYPNNPGDND